MNFIFDVWPFRLFLEKEDNKEKHKLFLGTNVSPRYTVTTRTSSDQSSYYEPVARGNGFQLFGSNTQQEEQQISNKLSASILQACAQIIS